MMVINFGQTLGAFTYSKRKPNYCLSRTDQKFWNACVHLVQMKLSRTGHLVIVLMPPDNAARKSNVTTCKLKPIHSFRAEGFTESDETVEAGITTPAHNTAATSARVRQHNAHETYSAAELSTISSLIVHILLLLRLLHSYLHVFTTCVAL